MKKRRILIASIVAMTLQAPLAIPAIAAPLATGEPARLSSPVNSHQPIDITHGDCAQPRTLAAARVQTTPFVSKAASILGGQLSRLEMIGQQQTQPSPPVQVQQAAASEAPAIDIGKKIEPAAGGFNCASFVKPAISTLATAPGIMRPPLGSDDFLASKRLPVSRTSFDHSWARVRSGSVSRNFMHGILPQARSASLESIAAVNSWANAKIRYVEDRELYGRSDYWANARATISRRAGDCEDIAIAKMQMLAALGVPRDAMFLTVARDLARNADHALLIVKFDGRYLMLDNNTNAVLDASGSYDYRPIMSFSADGKWLHGYAA